jgi:hypothetical protein
MSPLARRLTYGFLFVLGIAFGRGVGDDGGAWRADQEGLDLTNGDVPELSL